MKRESLIAAILPLIMLASCKEYAPYETKDVEIKIDVKQCSAGYVEAEFSTSKNAYFYCGIVELDSGTTEPYTDAQHFMTMVLDSVQIEYMKWRHDLLRDNVPYIASFKDHCLKYGKTDEFFIRLRNETSYMVYAFVVDVEKNEPIGKLYKMVVTTKQISIVDITFDYRINGSWDYVYPKNTLGEIVSNHPYNVLTLSEDSLRWITKNDPAFLGTTPFFFYAFLFTYTNYNVTMSVESTLYMGIRAESHNEDSKAIEFKEGKTYYTGIASADGTPRTDQIAVYKFRWEGDEMKQVFQYQSDTLGMYEW